jgi:hypothetical protein
MMIQLRVFLWKNQKFVNQIKFNQFIHSFFIGQLNLNMIGIVDI